MDSKSNVHKVQKTPFSPLGVTDTVAQSSCYHCNAPTIPTHYYNLMHYNISSSTDMVLEVEGSLSVGSQLIVNTCAMTPEERHDEGERHVAAAGKYFHLLSSWLVCDVEYVPVG